MRGFVRGLVAAAVGQTEEQRRAAVEDWKSRWQQWVARMAGPQGSTGADFPGTEGLDALRSALIGRTKADVAAMMGPPPATSAQQAKTATGTYWYADTWYYPLSSPRHHAIAVNFENGLVNSIEHLVVPGK